MGGTAVWGQEPIYKIFIAAPGGAPAVPAPPKAARAAPDMLLDRYFADVVAVGSEGGYHCSGVQVGPRAVLTARHCLPATRVLFGQDVEHPLRVARVGHSRSAPEERMDAALLFLDSDVPQAPRSRRGAAESEAPSGAVRLIGFGATDAAGKRGYGVKRMVDVPVLGWGCDAYRSRSAGCEPDLELVLPRSGDRDTCDGDSGGPVFEFHRGAWRLLAITSRPVASARVRCGPGGIYQRLDRLAPWIDREVSPPPRTEAPK